MRALMFCVLVGVCVLCRSIEHVPNFTPMAAVALFAGFWFAHRRTALLTVLAAMLISDLVVLGVYDWRVMAVVYVSLLAPVACRAILRNRLTTARVGTAAVGSSVLFFFATNFAHWLFMGMYDLSASGLALCLAAGLPFLKYQLAGDLLWSGGLFGAVALAERYAQYQWARTQRVPA